MARVFDILTLVVGGIILADLVAHGTQTMQVLDGVSTLWKTSVNGMLGQTS
jgi:hypothetical protein